MLPIPILGAFLELSKNGPEKQGNPAEPEPSIMGKIM